MKIQAINNNCQNNVSHKNLYKTNSLKQLEKTSTKEFMNNVENISKTIKIQGLHKLENVDIFLNYTKEQGFYGIISSKKEGTPNHPKNTCPISIIDGESIDNFSNWAKDWDSAYSPVVLDLLKKLIGRS